MSDSIAYDDTGNDSTGWDSSTQQTFLTGVANRIHVIKDSMTIKVDFVSNTMLKLVNSFPSPASPTVQFRLMVNNGSGFKQVDSGSYTVSGNQNATNAIDYLVWNIPSDGYYVNANPGDNFQFKVEAYVSDDDDAYSGSVTLDYDLDDAEDTISYNQFPAIYSTSQGSILRTI